MIKEKTLISIQEIRSKNGASLSLQAICDHIKQKAAEYGIPVNCSIDQIKTGVLFGTTEDCVALRNPTNATYYTYVITVQHQGAYSITSVYKTNGCTPDSTSFEVQESLRSAQPRKRKIDENGWYGAIEDFIESMFK